MNIFNKLKRNNELAENNITYMTIMDFFFIKDFGVAVVCMIEEGELNINDTVQINGRIDTVIAIEYNGHRLKSAEAGMVVGILLKNIQKSDVIVGERIEKINL